MSGWMLLLAGVATLAIFATTRSGREVAKRIGLRDHVPGAASSADVAFLLKACNGDREEVARLLDAERVRYSELSEAEHYRRAIRKVMTHGDRGEGTR